MRVSRVTLLLALFFGSGVAGLGYQMVWTRVFSAGLGHEVPAMVSVIAAILCGMAGGAWTLDRRIARSPDPGRWFGGLELCVGGWGLLTAWLIPLVNELALHLLGPQPSVAWHWAVVFVVPFVTLLPATVAMGAALPAMERFLTPIARDGGSVALVYAMNTFGSVVGTLGSVVFLMPWLGLPGTLVGLSLINAVVGVTALRVRRRMKPAIEPSELAAKSPATRRRPAPVSEPSQDSPAGGAQLGWILAVTGLLGMGYELVGIRALSQVLENTVYTFAATLSVYLVGMAVGAAAYHRFLRKRSWRSTLVWLLAGLSCACVVGGWSLRVSFGFHDRCRDLLGDTIGGAVLAEVLVAGTLFALPTVFMGAIFSHLAQAARRPEGGVGWAMALNTFGCGLAAVVVTLFLLPNLGLRWSLMALAAGYVALMAVAGRVRWRKEWWAVAVPVVAIVFFPDRLRLLRLLEGSELLEYREGVMSSAAAVKLADGERALRVNNRLQMGGTGATFSQEREAHLPLLLHPQPRSALFLGPGTGITLGAADLHPGLQATGVELLPEVSALMRHFEPENRGPFPKPNIRLVVADARRFVRTTTNRYDVVVADLFHPAQDGAGFLYTREQFAAIRQNLAPGGVFCQWLPLHQMDAQTLRVIVQTFLSVFSRSHGFLLHFNVDVPVLGLMGTRDGLDLNPARVEERLNDPGFKAAMRGFGLDRSINLLGCFAAGPEMLRRIARDAEVATDNRPVVTFLAPRFSAKRNEPPHGLLLEFLEETRDRGVEMRKGSSLSRDPTYFQVLENYWAARDEYLVGLAREGEGGLTAAIELYLASARRSLYFTPAYARMVTIIEVMAQVDRPRAQELWRRLEVAQPDQPLGRRLLPRLFDTAAPGDVGVGAP